jgi:hypothetical protein
LAVVALEPAVKRTGYDRQNRIIERGAVRGVRSAV